MVPWDSHDHLCDVVLKSHGAEHPKAKAKAKPEMDTTWLTFDAIFDNEQ